MNPKPLLMATCMAAALLLSACGGGGDEAAAPAAAPADAIPTTASQSAEGLENYLTALSTASADTKAPLDVSSFNPAKPDNTEPIDF